MFSFYACHNIPFRLSPGGARGLVLYSADLLALAVADLLQGFAAHPHSLLTGLRAEGDLTTLLKILSAHLVTGVSMGPGQISHLLVTRLVECDVTDVTLLLLAVAALQHRVGLHRLNKVLLHVFAGNVIPQFKCMGCKGHCWDYITALRACVTQSCPDSDNFPSELKLMLPGLGLGTT